MVRPRSLPVAVDQRRGEVNRIAEAGAQWFHITGEIQVFGAGAANVDVSFPVYFSEKPRFSFGSELAPGESYATGNMPTCVATILAWDQRLREDDTAVYAGATFCIVTTGPSAQSMIAHWHMEGVGLRGPSNTFD